MGIVTCSRCKATTKADSIEEGRPKLDHAIGLYIGKPCEDGKAELFFTGKKKTISNIPKEKDKGIKKMIDKTAKQTKEFFKPTHTD